MSVELSLSKFAERLMPRDYLAWQVTWDIVVGRRPFPACRKKGIDRAVERLREKHRLALLERYKVDPQTMLSSPRAAGTFGLLNNYLILAERKQEFELRALGNARDEVAARLRTKYERWSDLFHSRMADRLREAMCEDRVHVTATHNGRDRHHIPSEDIAEAKIDLCRRTLSIEWRRERTIWKAVVIEFPVGAFAPTPSRSTLAAMSFPAASKYSPFASDEPGVDLQKRFDEEIRRRINTGEKWNRDTMTLWARTELQVDTDMSHALWTNRPEDCSRRGGRLKSSRRFRQRSG
jgi:hypothetical protein